MMEFKKSSQINCWGFFLQKEEKKFNQDHAKDNIWNLLKNLSVMHEIYLLQGGLALSVSFLLISEFMLNEKFQQNT